MLVNAADMLKKAEAGKYALGAFNTNNLEWTLAILQAAEEAKSPLILQCTAGAAKWMGGFKVCADMVKAAVEATGVTVPVRPYVQAACEMLGYDVLQVANEGKMVAVVPAEQADAALAAMRAARYGENAAIIGRVLPVAEGARPAVRVRTGWGSTRILDMLVGEQLPRIC